MEFLSALKKCSGTFRNFRKVKLELFTHLKLTVPLRVPLNNH